MSVSHDMIQNTCDKHIVEHMQRHEERTNMRIDYSISMVALVTQLKPLHLRIILILFARTYIVHVFKVFVF